MAAMPLGPSATPQVKQCPFCLENIPFQARKCSRCGEWLDSESRRHQSSRGWNPGIAAVLSFFIPGLGQIYKGQIREGVFWLIGAVFFLLWGWSLLFIPNIVYALVCTTNAYSYDPQALSAEDRLIRSRKIRRTLALLIGLASILRALFAFIAFWVGTGSKGFDFVLGNLAIGIVGVGIALYIWPKRGMQSER